MGRIVGKEVVTVMDSILYSIKNAKSLGEMGKNALEQVEIAKIIGNKHFSPEELNVMANKVRTNMNPSTDAFKKR